MPSARTAAEFAASARGEVRVAVKSPENLIGGGSVTGATLLIRAIKAALQQAGRAAVSDAMLQWQNIEAGIQEKYDGWRTGKSAGFAALSSAVGAAKKQDYDAAILGIRSKVMQIAFDREIAAIKAKARRKTGLEEL